MLVKGGGEITTRREVDTRWRCWGRLILSVFLNVLVVDLRMRPSYKHYPNPLDVAQVLDSTASI
jgi:hypothetical protein